jgi:cobalamin biosynthetic protein CobC
VVVLRSFGKFFGLAGVRLGFALSDTLTAERLEAQLGPWAVAGPALEYGIRALADSNWQAGMRQRLAEDARRLDALLGRFGIAVTGGTTLFRYLSFPGASTLFSALGERGVLVRHFAERPDVLRVGLPASEAEWLRLEEALAAWRSRRDGGAKEIAR